MLTRSSHKENSKAWWDELYSSKGEQFFYGKEPSNWLMGHTDSLPAGASILEVGCGEGRNAVALAAKGFQVKAIDFSSVALGRAEDLAKNSGVSVEWKSTDLDLFLPQLMSFDAIVCVNVKMPKTLLANLARGLKQNGHVFVDTYLMISAKEGRAEAFECFQSNELLKLLTASGASFRILHYSELDQDLKIDSGRVRLIARKTQLF